MGLESRLKGVFSCSRAPWVRKRRLAVEKGTIRLWRPFRPDSRLRRGGPESLNNTKAKDGKLYSSQANNSNFKEMTEEKCKDQHERCIRDLKAVLGQSVR